MSRRYDSHSYRYDSHRESPKVEGLKVKWIETIDSEAFYDCRKLRRSGLLNLYSMQVYEINLKRCNPDFADPRQLANASPEHLSDELNVSVEEAEDIVVKAKVLVHHCKRCLVRKKAVEKVGWGGPDVCSLVRALLALECGFYKMSIAEKDYTCSFCREDIIRGRWHSHVVQFGYEPLRLCLRCLMPDERG